MKNILLIFIMAVGFLTAKGQDTTYVDTSLQVVLDIGPSYKDTIVFNWQSFGIAPDQVYQFTLVEYDATGQPEVKLMSRGISRRAILTVLRDLRDTEIVERDRAIARIQRLLDLRNEAIEWRDDSNEVILYYNNQIQTIINE